MTTAPTIGVAAVDAAIAAALAADEAALQAQVVLHPYGCVASGMGALLCAPGEVAGTQVAGFVVSGCDGTIERDPARISAVVATAATKARGLVGVAVSASGSDYYVALATSGAGLVLYVDADGIKGINLGCDRPAAEMLYDRPDATILLPPPGG